MSRSLRPMVFVVAGLVLGASLGLVAGPWVKELALFSKLAIQLIKALATPLVFFATLEAVLLHKMARRDFGMLLGIVLVNAIIAVGIGVLFSNLFEPGRDLEFLREHVQEAKKLATPEVSELIKRQIPSSILSPFVDNDVLGVVVLALGLAFALRRVENEGAAVSSSIFGKLRSGVTLARQVSEVLLGWIVGLVPLVVFAAAATITHEHGLSPFRGLGRYVGLCLLGMGTHLVFTYSGWLFLVAKVGVARFFGAFLTPALFAMGVNSSLVTLPHTLKALDSLGVSRKAATLTTCIGTNLNNDGIILYEGFTLLALAQAFGMHLTLVEQLIAAMTCLVAAMGVAGIPEAGVVALTLVLGTFGLPPEALALLLSVDWVIARGRSVLNVASDMVGAAVLDRFVRPDAATLNEARSDEEAAPLG